jgi:hypothetical protein
VAVAGVLTVALTQNTTGAVFTGQTVDTGSSVTAAPDFCTTPGRIDTLSAGAVDTGVAEGNPLTNYATNPVIGVAQTSSSTGRARTLIKFALLGKPSGCVVASAVLKLHVSSGATPANVTVYRAAAAWDPATVLWGTDPGIVAGSGTTTAAITTGTAQWDVATQVTALYAGTDNGFELRDASETLGSLTQLYDSMEATTVANRPQLVITWN